MSQFVKALPNQGIELLYTAECQSWAGALANLTQALHELKIKDEPTVIKIETIEQAELYNFYASPTIHINGTDIDPMARRITRRGLGRNRPYWHKQQALAVPPIEMIKAGIRELYLHT